MPDPAWIWVRSMPLSAASLLAAGLANALPPVAALGTAGAGVGAADGVGGGGGGGGGGVAAGRGGAAAAGGAAWAGEASELLPSSTKSLNLATSS